MRKHHAAACLCFGRRVIAAWRPSSAAELEGELAIGRGDRLHHGRVPSERASRRLISAHARRSGVYRYACLVVTIGYLIHPAMAG